MSGVICPMCGTLAAEDARCGCPRDELTPDGGVVLHGADGAGPVRPTRTVNGLERLNREIRRRTRVAVLFPNEASCLRLATAIVMEVSEEWEPGRVYLRLDEPDR